MTLLRDLSPGALVSWRAHDSLELTCVEGAVWVTQAGDGADYVLERGQRRVFPANAHTVLQALSAAEVRVCSPTCSGAPQPVAA